MQGMLRMQIGGRGGTLMNGGSVVGITPCCQARPRLSLWLVLLLYTTQPAVQPVAPYAASADTCDASKLQRWHPINAVIKKPIGVSH